jgi:DNA-binding beta-propeller fold protein YncE
MAKREQQVQQEASRVWDALARGRSPESGGLDPALLETMRRLQRLGAQPRPDTAFADRLEADLTHAQERVVQRSALPLRESAPIPVTNFPGRSPTSPSSPHRRDWRRSPRWAWGQLATAALLLLTVVGSFLAFGPDRLGHQPQSPAMLPAISGTPAIGAAPIAEVLWQSSGGPELPFAYPSHPAIDAGGTLWVPDSSHDQFLLFAPDGTFLEAWGTPGTGEGQFHLGDPRDMGIGSGAVAFDAAGNIYVVDTGNHRIQKFGPDRAFITAWGSEGSGDGQFRRPVDLAVDGRGRVYVSDTGWGTIQVFDDDGTWLATWSGLGTPAGLAVDGDGNLWVAEGGSGVVKFSAEGERLATWNDYGTGEGQFLDSVSVAVDAQGRVFVADLSADRVQVFSPDGAFLGAWGESGTEAGQFRGPRGLVLDGKGAVYVTEFSGKRVQKFRLLPPLDPVS